MRSLTMAVAVAAISALSALSPLTAEAQVPEFPRAPVYGTPKKAKEHARLFFDVGQQTSATTLKQTLTFDQYFETGTLTIDRAVPKRQFFDVGGWARVGGGLHAGVTLSQFKSAGSGDATVSAPHPFFFNQFRTATGTISGMDRRENAVHIQLGWTIPVAGGLEFTPFGGPTLFKAEQVLANGVSLSLDDEVYPYDTLATFPRVTTENVKANVTGYNAGVDMTWRFSKVLGAGVIFRYSHGTKDVTPTGGQATTIEVGGLHAGGGLRLVF